MKRSLRIVIADDEPLMQKYYRKILTSLGHTVVAAAGTGRELIEMCREEHPDLILTDIKMPDLDGIEAAAQIYSECPVPVILVSAYNDHSYIERSEADYILSYLIKPIRQANLAPAIPMVMRKFEQFQALYRETSDLKQTLEDRKLIERAKGLLMKNTPLDEAGAFRRLQRIASDQNRKLVEVAKMLLTADEVFH
ncbi:MAG: pdtaR 1 [Planctomycetota bacterium]|nr:pdtaR 1 [Planctomycetota bacterium]